MTLASVLLGFSLFWLSYFDKIAQFFNFLPSMGVYSLLMILGIFSLRFFGQGLLPVTANTMIGKWFVKKRGTAFAVLGVVNSLAFSAAPAVMAAFVSNLGWSKAWQVMAVIVGVGMGLLALLFYRDTPEKMGLSVDGKNQESASSSLSPPSGVLPKGADPSPGTMNKIPEMYGLTRSQAIRTRSFWAVVLVIATNALVMTGLTFHIQALGIQSGLSLAKAVAIFIPVSFIGVPLSFISAVLTDRIHVRYLVYTMALSQLVSYIAVFFLNTHGGYIVTIIGLGISSGLMGPLQTAVIPKIFGRKYLGSLNGLVGSLGVIGSAMGPILLSSVNDALGSLRLGVSLMSLLPLVALVLAFRMPESFER